jgi:hypothetical protein
VRLTDVVTHIVDKLNQSESRFHASLVTNVVDLVDLLPRLNVNQDEELNRFAAEIKDRLCNFSAHEEGCRCQRLRMNFMCNLCLDSDRGDGHY